MIKLIYKSCNDRKSYFDKGRFNNKYVLGIGRKRKRKNKSPKQMADEISNYVDCSVSSNPSMIDCGNV